MLSCLSSSDAMIFFIDFFLMLDGFLHLFFCIFFFVLALEVLTHFSSSTSLQNLNPEGRLAFNDTHISSPLRLTISFIGRPNASFGAVALEYVLPSGAFINLNL